ncbi:uncharacterized protein [Typha latifolia]|uniref:uncharacterized protein n=1 Tax=Typha latifolia TaxID=4733 RepID=UPI003C2DF6B0
MDWIFTTTESSGDSEVDVEADADLTSTVGADNNDYDDDAESYSGGGRFDAGDGDEEEDADADGGETHGEVDERWMSWRSWLMENAAKCEDDEGCSREDGMDLSAAAAVGGDVERDRVFWEACLAHGY